MRREAVCSRCASEHMQKAEGETISRAFSGLERRPMDGARCCGVHTVTSFFQDRKLRPSRREMMRGRRSALYC